MIIKINKETIQQARQADLAHHLLSIGEPLKKEGKYYRHKNHKNLIIENNSFFWNDRAGEGKGIESGNAIDYLVNHMGKTFPEAVQELTKNIAIQELSSETKDRYNPTFSLTSIAFCSNQDKASQYLANERFIGLNIINYITSKGLLLQETGTNNAFFSIYDEKGDCVGGERQGITQKRFKGIAVGTRYGYGFNIQFPNADGTFKYALFFESAVDLLSFMDITKYRDKKPLNGCLLVSMGGLKLNIIKHMSMVFSKGSKPLEVVLCLDNDSAGEKLENEVKKAGVLCRVRQPISIFKDWNEQLQRGKEECTPIGRLKSRAMGESAFDL